MGKAPAKDNLPVYVAIWYPKDTIQPGDECYDGSTGGKWLVLGVEHFMVGRSRDEFPKTHFRRRVE